MAANWITTWGFGQYAVVKGRGPEANEATWHATLAYLVLGSVSLVGLVLFGGHLMPLLNAPPAAAYVPGMALVFFIKRWGAIPERVLTRQMNFRASGMALAFGEIAYTIAAISFAVLGWGGMSIVYANIVQSLVMVAILISAAGRAAWTPMPVSAARIKDMLAFGLPLAVQGIAARRRYLDKLVVSYYWPTARPVQLATSRTSWRSGRRADRAQS
jgi:PST family polysaccharide transporter